MTKRKSTLPHSPTSILLRLLLLWVLVTFSPVWLILYQFSSLTPFIESLLKTSGLHQNFETVKSAAFFSKKWCLGVLRLMLSRSTKSKYPFGYAMLKKNGKYMYDHSNHPYVIQLYDYIARKFMYLKNLATFRVLEIEPTTDGGLEYLATSLKAASCLGVALDQVSFSTLSRSNINPRVKFTCSPNLDSMDIKRGNYDCVIGINIFQRSTCMDRILEVMKLSLKPNGYVCLAEYLLVQQISCFEYCLRQAGFRISKSENLTSNLSYSIKLQARSEVKESLFQRLRRSVYQLMQEENIQIDILDELQARRKFIAYILEVEAKV